VPTFDSLADAFNRQSSLAIHCAVRNPCNVFDAMVYPERLIRYYGNPFEESLAESKDGEIQQVSLFSDCSNDHQSLEDWRGFATEAGLKLIEIGSTSSTTLLHSPAAEWTLACLRALGGLKTDFVDQEQFDQRKGFVTNLVNAWGMSSLVCLELAKGGVPRAKPGGNDPEVGVQDCDGLFDDDRILVWGGIQFPLTTNQALVFRLLVDAYPDDVTGHAFAGKGIGALRDSFRFNKKERQKRGYDYYPCWSLIGPGSVRDSKRLIDPSVVRSNPKKFSDPQHNPHKPPA
jgi:hypothetical protein